MSINYFFPIIYSNSLHKKKAFWKLIKYFCPYAIEQSEKWNSQKSFIRQATTSAGHAFGGTILAAIIHFIVFLEKVLVGFANGFRYGTPFGKQQFCRWYYFNSVTSSTVTTHFKRFTRILNHTLRGLNVVADKHMDKHVKIISNGKHINYQKYTKTIENASKAYASIYYDRS